MAGCVAPPPPPSNSSAPQFKTNTSGPNPGHAPAQVAPASPAAAAPPMGACVPSDAVVAVLGVVGELRARGFLAGLEIPEAELTEARAPALFDGVLAAFLAETGAARATPSLPIPPPALGDGSKVELLRLYLAVRARGGFTSVASWAAVAEVVSLGPAAGAAVELLYGKYLALLEQSIGNCKAREDHEAAESSRNAGRRLGSKKDRFLSRTNGPRSAGSAHLKRKRDALVGMLNWVRLVAQSPSEPGVFGRNFRGHFSTAVLIRRQMFANKDCRSGSSSPQSGHSNVEGARYNEWDLVPPLLSIDSIFAAPIRPCGQADIPGWTGKPSLPYDDPHALKFLGEPILIPESKEDLDGGFIGKGRQDDCNCQFPGSIACVRFHVTEKKIELKRELGSAFYEMGFHRIGKDLALTWAKDEERKFNTTVQENLPSFKYKFWDKLLAVFRSKGREALVSYYHNVFQVWRRAYQNRLAPNAADSDDDSIEPGFLYLHQGGGKSSSRSVASSRNRRNS